MVEVLTICAIQVHFPSFLSQQNDILVFETENLNDENTRFLVAYPVELSG